MAGAHADCDLVPAHEQHIACCGLSAQNEQVVSSRGRGVGVNEEGDRVEEVPATPALFHGHVRPLRSNGRPTVGV